VSSWSPERVSPDAPNLEKTLTVDRAFPSSLTRALSLVAKLATGALVVAILSRGRPFLLPVAFAAVLAFILTSPMKWLERRISRLPALALVMLLAAGTMGGAGFVLVTQFDDLTTQLGKYTESMRRKVVALQSGAGGPLARVEVMIARVADGLEKKGGADEDVVRLVPARVSRAAHLWDLIKPLAEPLITALFVLVLCVFMLARRNDLRNRLIGLVGTGNVTSTTRALDEGALRITRYLRDQTIVNALFGVVVGAGLYLIGVPYAVLWGAVAALARFVPYLGSIASMLMPAALAFAIYPGWSRTLLTIALFVGMDLVTAYGIEPVLFGRRTGVSSIALLLSAFFWAWIWGPVGLALAIPITVSLAVLGRHVPDLEFLAVLLGDEQVIGPEISFYQRLLARDEDGASEVVQESLDDLGRGGVLDRIVIPTIALSARDLVRRRISAEDQALIVTWSRDIVEHLAREEGGAQGAGPIRALGVAAHRSESELLLEMLAVELAAEQARMEVVPATSGLTEVLARVERDSPDVVCIGSFAPEGGPHARRLCQGIKGRFPRSILVAFRPDEPDVDPARAAGRLRDAGADLVVSSLAQARDEISRLLLARPGTPRAPGTPKPVDPDGGGRESGRVHILPAGG
jgi:predicted PurR-regulated permease PerM